jgi:hypothetical protein
MEDVECECKKTYLKIFNLLRKEHEMQKIGIDMGRYVDVEIQKMHDAFLDKVRPGRKQRMIKDALVELVFASLIPFGICIYQIYAHPT